MTAYRTERATVTLADLLAREMEKRNWSLRDAEAHTGVSRNAIDNILKNAETVPNLETLHRLAVAFQVPLWRIVELAGFASGVVPNGDTPQGRIHRVMKLSQAMPQLAELLDLALELPPSDVEGVLAYLEALKRRRDAAGLGPGDPAE
jgi:transcriptional regulator with XRE-family HTH domain